MQTNQLTFGSLFAGIGGIDLGFERAGLNCKWQVEINDYAQKVLAKHWPKVYRERDIRECSAQNLERVDVICGGFPCQDISYAGLGAGLDGERSGLFFEALRVVCELRPRIVVLENVAALLTRGLDRVLGSLAEVGYDAEWHCIPAAAVGAPHYRDRVFVLAFNANGFNVSSLRASAKFQQETAASRSSGKEDSKACTDTNGNRFDKTREGIASTWSDGIVRNDWWATEPAVGRVADGVSNRVDRLRGLGNAVVPQVAELVARRVISINNRIAKEQNAND